MAEIANIYNEAGGEPPDEPYIKKAGDTATGLIVFNGGIEVNFGSTIIDGPAEFSDTVLFKPSADIIIQCPVTLQGPELIIGCDDTQFTGNTVEFNSPAVSIGNGGQGSLTLECGLDIGGFGSINMLNSSINMQDNSIINQFGTRSINNVLGSTNIINGSVLQFNSDFTQQTSAFTGAAALAGSYTLSNITINANGAISAISNGSAPPLPTNASFNQINCNKLVLPQTLPVVPSNPTGDIYCPAGNVGNATINGTGGINSTYVNDFVASQGFLISLTQYGGSPSYLTGIPAIKFQLTFSFFGPVSSTPTQYYENWGQTTCTIDMYPPTWTQTNWTPGTAIGGFYNINNKILGNGGFGLSVPVLTASPNGRQYWTYNQQFSGISGPNGYFVPLNAWQWAIVLTIPNNGYSWSGRLQTLDAQAPLSFTFPANVGVTPFNVTV